jgi:general stress protein 26
MPVAQPMDATRICPMHTPQELEAKFWKALKSDMTVMLGVEGLDDGHMRPMTAQFDGAPEQGPIWFFTSADNQIVQALPTYDRASCAFASKDHELFACVHGVLSIDHDREQIDRLWSPFVAAWFEGGKDDPKLRLLRLDAEHGEIWLNESSVFAGIKLLLGADPKKAYRDKVAKVDLR